MSARRFADRAPGKGGRSSWYSSGSLNPGELFQNWWLVDPLKVSPTPTNGSTVQSFTSSVSTLTASSPVGYGPIILSQSSPAAQPTYSTGSSYFNYRPTLTFDSADWMSTTLSGSFSTRPLTMWWVARNLAPTGSSYVMGAYFNTSYIFAHWNRSTQAMNYIEGAGTTQMTSSANMQNVYSWTITLGANGTGSLYRNGVAVATFTKSAVASGNVTTFYLGLNTNPAHMELAECGTATRALTAAEVLKLHNDYVGPRYGL